LSLRSITFKAKYFKIVLVVTAIGCIFIGCIFVRWNLGNVAAQQTDPKGRDSIDIAKWLAELSPSDPRTHLFAAKAYESTFDPNDLYRSVREYELAASLSPHNFATWLSLARSRGLQGDVEGSFKAYDRALGLAPNYSLPRWMYGNALLRDGRTDEGFSLVSAAASSDPKYLRPAISTALQLFDGNVDAVRRGLGNTVQTNAGLARELFVLGRIQESFESWQQIEPEAKKQEFRELGQMLSTKFADLKKFRMAASIQCDIDFDRSGVTGKVVNGGFEEEVRLGNTDIFNWRITEGSHPQVGISETVKRSGKYGLILMFSSFESAGFRSLEQLLPVEPSVDYELEMYFRSDLRTEATLRWEVIDAVTSKLIAASDPINKAADWTPLRIRFKVPGDSDGVQIRFVRNGCTGPACPMNGRLIFDDFSLKRL
jgi:hypothetical protein